MEKRANNGRGGRQAEQDWHYPHGHLTTTHSLLTLTNYQTVLGFIGPLLPQTPPTHSDQFLPDPAYLLPRAHQSPEFIISNKVSIKNEFHQPPKFISLSSILLICKLSNLISRISDIATAASSAPHPSISLTICFFFFFFFQMTTNEATAPGQFCWFFNNASP